MSDDEDFRPRLGRMRARGTKRGRKYLGRILAATALAGGIKQMGRSRFDGSRIGRGAGIGRVLGSRDRLAGLRARRVIIKSRIVRLAGKGVQNAQLHLRYIQRGGVTREGEPGQLYSAGHDIAEGKAFLERGSDDRHQFRFIVSAEDGDQYEDLKLLTRALMSQIESDLGTRLDWVAVDHFNTGHPHTHIMLRGVDERGQNLIIAREYMGTGMRERLAERVRLDLGPRTDLEIEERLRHDIGAERLTVIDRRLARGAGDDHVVGVADRDRFQQSLRAGRLQKLERLGLAEDLGKGRWRLARGFEETLRRMGERGDIIRTMQRELTAGKLDRSPDDQIVHDLAMPAVKPVTGRLVARGLSDELADRHYLIVDGLDGRSHYIDIGEGSATPPIPTNAIVEITPRGQDIRQVDRTIAEVAAASGGHYDVEVHLQHDLTATEAFAQTHVRRLEAIRRKMQSVEREPSGRWVIATDHLERVAAYEARLARDRPVMITVQSALALDKQIRFDGATWLDRSLVEPSSYPLRESGFGQEVSAAQKRRQLWLAQQDLADVEGGRTICRPGMIAALQRRELIRVAGQLSSETGLRFADTNPGDRVEGVFKRHIDLAQGRFAIIEKSREFSLVPWKPVLEKQIGKQVSGIVRESGISWTFGRQRGPEIS